MHDTPPETFLVPTGDDHPVVADFYAPPGMAMGTPLARAVVMCHGFKGHRRWGFIPYMAQRLREAGIATVAIDFSHNGRVPTENPAPDTADAPFVAPQLFQANTLGRERSDLAATLTWLRSPKSGGPFLVNETAPVGLWGHSRGGVSVILTALDDPAVRAVSTVATTNHPDTYSEHQKERWHREGAFKFTDSDSGTKLAIGIEYLRELEREHDTYNLVSRAGELRAAHLIVHGEHDVVVPVFDGQRFYEVEEMHADKKFLRMFTGHLFGFAPDKPVNEVLTQTGDKTIEWFDEYLKQD
jgi:alpha-beta hydrolase superfamily lysophospholipase